MSYADLKTLPKKSREKIPKNVAPEVQGNVKNYFSQKSPQSILLETWKDSLTTMPKNVVKNTEKTRSNCQKETKNSDL